MLALVLALTAASPEAFLHQIYDRYVGKEARGVPLDTAADVRRWFAPELAKKILADRAKAEKAGDVPTLDGDPFVDAQDWEISALDIKVQGATGTVKFTNAGEPIEIVLDLVNTPSGWRIREITSRGQKLSALFK